MFTQENLHNFLKTTTNIWKPTSNLKSWKIIMHIHVQCTYIWIQTNFFNFNQNYEISEKKYSKISEKVYKYTYNYSKTYKKVKIIHNMTYKT